MTFKSAEDVGDSFFYFLKWLGWQGLAGPWDSCWEWLRGSPRSDIPKVCQSSSIRH